MYIGLSINFPIEWFFTPQNFAIHTFSCKFIAISQKTSCAFSCRAVIFLTIVGNQLCNGSKIYFLNKKFVQMITHFNKLSVTADDYIKRITVKVLLKFF